MVMDEILIHLPRYLNATWLTIWMFTVVMVASTAIGGVCAFLAETVMPLLRIPFGVYSWVFRGLPELVVLLFCYLGLPFLGIDLGAIGSALLGLIIVSVAYQYEIFRGGIAAIDTRQFEAARALGIPLGTVLRRIILPQVVMTIVRPWVTFAAGDVKGLSITSAVAVMEVMAVTRQTIAITEKPFLFILIAALIYGTIASALMVAELVISRRIERRYGVGART
jgi:His/Glu/Gln/Arg/opine family amino acid ABC transporter permease subunit